MILLGSAHGDVLREAQRRRLSILPAISAAGLILVSVAGPRPWVGINIEGLGAIPAAATTVHPVRNPAVLLTVR
jgi:hypothetical protein